MGPCRDYKRYPLLKLAFSTNAFKNYALQDAIKVISRLGYDGVEILCNIPHAYPETFSEKKLIMIKNLLTKEEISVSNLNAFTLYALGDLYHPSWIEADMEKRFLRINHTINCIKLARKLGSKNISTEPGGPLQLGNRDRDRLLKVFVNSLKKVLPAAEEQGIKILIEPEPKLLIENSEEFLKIIRMIDSPFVKLNFDIGHFFCVGEEPSRAIYKLYEYIEHFHIEDISKERIHKHLQLGKGVIDFKSIFRTIHDIGFNGFVTVELYPYQDCPEHVAKESLEYLADLIP